ncbi:uncharacterized protein [Drosophila bipectinata]|uniref:uncharacterized protein n=1 Tax=Drosophila bipectinata TaxID=42026 RepID=UPI0038B2F969
MNSSGADKGAPTPTRSAILKCKALGILQDLKRIQRAPQPVSKVDDAMLNVRLGQIVAIFSDFKAIHGELEDLDISQISTNGMSTMQVDSGSGQRFQALPPLPFPTFSGRYSEWPEFYSIFCTIVGGNPSINKVEKLQRLRSCLRESAFEAVRSLEVSDENYDAALNLLEKRFNSRRLIFQAHVNEILGLTLVGGDSITRLRWLSDKFNALMRTFKNLGSTNEIAGCIIVLVLLQRLDPATQVKWEESLNSSSSDAIPTWKSLAEFLEQRCRTLEAMDVAAGQSYGADPSSGWSASLGAD